MMRKTLVALCCLAGCGSPQPGSTAPAASQSVAGQESDVSVALGDYDGYRVARECKAESVAIAVIGLGPNLVERIAEGAPERQAALLRFKNGALASALEAVPSMHSHGIGAACQGGGVGIVVSLSDWKDVDLAVGVIGELLRREELSEQIVIQVSAVPTILG